MNHSRYIILLGLLLFSLLVLSRADDDFEDDGFIKCGRLYDGITRDYDVGRQKPDYPISANWKDFTHDDDKDAKIKYQFAIISQEVLTETILYSGPEAPTKRRCRRDDGLEGLKPDVVGWTTLTFDKKKTTKDTDGAFRIYDLDLKNKYRYYVILSASYKNETIYTNSDGVYITDRDNYDDDDDDDSNLLLLLLLLLLLIPCCLLLLLIIFLCVYRNKDDKYQTVVQRSG
jgi:hypothetical protein